MPDYLSLAKEAYDASTTYFEANVRPELEYSVRAFRNEHAPGSKYLSPEFASRSRIFRPKTRTVIRKNEAAAAVALFSNMDIVDVTPGNPDNAMSVASASCMKAILEYRLSKTIPAFPLVMGAIQDAQVAGAVCSYQYWEYQSRDGKVKKDKPCIELRPLENLRFDHGASWLDPVNTSPYWCDIIPMYVCDVKAMMESEDEKTGSPKWKKYDDSVILRAKPDVLNSLYRARTNKQEPEEFKSNITSFDTVWVMRWFLKNSQGDDEVFYTLGCEELLTDAKPIEEVYFHGKRPYVMGFSILETHKALKTPVPILVRPIQQETTDVANQRLDNVKFVLNKRWIVARGRQVDVNSLVRNAPGGVTMATDPKNDIQESNWADVTSSAYVEQDRLNSDFDDLIGNFSPATKVANNAVNDTLGGSRLASQGAGVMTDYLLRTVIETWWEPVLRQLVLLEQYYETDEMVLGLCADKARLFPRFGVSRITDDMLMNEVNVSVNVGMGASNPNERFQKFMVATKAASELAATAPPGFNLQEGIKEIFSNAGYRDGARFFGGDVDPRLAKAMQAIQQLQQVVEGKKLELQYQGQLEAAKIQSNEKIKGAEIAVNKSRIDGDLQIRSAEIAVEAARIELEKLKLSIELDSVKQEHDLRAAELGAGVEQAQLKLEQERQKIAGQALKMAAEIEKAKAELSTIKKGEENETRIGEVASGVERSMSSMVSEINSIKRALEDNAGEIGNLRQGLGVVGNVMMLPKRKAKGFVLKKDGKKTNAVVVEYDDGTSDEMTVA